MENVDGGGGAVKAAKRKVSNEDIIKYEPMVEKFIRDSCMKNWTEARSGTADSFLGTSGYSLNDLKQHLRTEICIALQNYNPDYRTKEGRSVKESTFVYQHLTFRVGQMMKRLVKRRMGYGVRHNPIQLVIEAGAEEADSEDLDLALAVDTNAAYTITVDNQTNTLKVEKKREVERFLEAKASGKTFYGTTKNRSNL